MSTDKQYTVGTILENKVKQFTKVISVRNGVYGLSGWTTLKNAEKATVARLFINSNGTRHAGCKVVKAGTKTKASDTGAPSGNDAGGFDLEKATGAVLKKILEDNQLDVPKKVADMRELVREKVDLSKLS